MLPKLRLGTYDSVAQSIEEYGDETDFIKEYLDHIKEENPVLLSFILKFVNKLKGKSFIAALAGICLTYKLLESESEALDFEKDMLASDGE